jgi:cell wall assembly regulator SMI1
MTASDDGSSPLPQLAAYEAFQSGIRERSAELPLVRSATVVGNHRMLELDPNPAGSLGQCGNRLSETSMPRQAASPEQGE